MGIYQLVHHNKAALFFINLLFAFLFLTGCTSAAEFTKDSGSQEEIPSESSARFPDYIYDQETSQDSYGTHAAVQEKGYYLIANNILYFYDVQSDSLFPLCTKESCLHNDDTCDAYIYDRYEWTFDGEGEDFMDDWASDAFSKKLYYYQDHLYMIACNPSKGYALMQYSPEFTEQKMITWLSDFEAEPMIVLNSSMNELGTILFHDGYAYYLTYEDDIEKIRENPDYLSVYTAWRVKLEEKAEAEELFSFDGKWFAGSHAYRIGSFQDDVYFIIDYLTGTGSHFSIYRYNEKDGAELIWNNEGDDRASPFEAEGAVPRNSFSKDYLINKEGDYVYFAGASEEWVFRSTCIAAVNLETKEVKGLYETPYEWIEQLRSDGINYYFLEFGKGPAFLTAIDKEGNLLRRYEIPYTEDFIKSMENSKIPKEEWTNVGERLRLLAADGRHIVLEGYNDNIYQGLSSHMKGYNAAKYNSVDEGIGVINTEGFLNGKDVEIRQIYERTDPF